MSKGTIAKKTIAEALEKAFGADYLGEVDKKLYLLVPDEGMQKIQVAVTLTCPKTPVAVNSLVSDKPVPPSSYEFGDDFTPPPQAKGSSTQLTQEEKDNIANLMAQLGL